MKMNFLALSHGKISEGCGIIITKYALMFIGLKTSISISNKIEHTLIDGPEINTLWLQNSSSQYRKHINTRSDNIEL